jgi:hypothetical protein
MEHESGMRETRNAHDMLFGQFGGKRSLGRPSFIQDNIKMNTKELEFPVW